MKAAERTLQQILHAADQYVIPVFQRYYTWEKANWDQLWDDVLAVAEHGSDSARHFMGSIVCVPEAHIPGVVPAYQVIDGQQRLTTLSLLLAAVRDGALGNGWNELAAEIEENYLVHRFKKGAERYKLHPRLRDRAAYLGIIDKSKEKLADSPDSRVVKSYDYHLARLKDEGLLASEEKLRAFFTVMTTRVDFVSITLSGESPYKIFKSLNSTGVDLEQGDLIRNHVFMALPVADQDTFDDEHWRPLERHFEKDGKLDGGSFAAFFRDALMRGGSYVGEDDIYEEFEKQYPLTKAKPVDIAREFGRRAKHYDWIRGVQAHTDAAVAEGLRSIRGLRASTAYPVVLALLDAQENGHFTLPELRTALSSISSFVLRRYVCGEGSRGYGRWFCAACRELSDQPLANLVKFLKGKGWPDDAAFVPKFERMNLYSSKYDREVLLSLERSIQANSERVSLDKCWIEHVMPQTIVESDEDGAKWVAALGADWKRVKGEWEATPGNLTLVGYDYNIQMQNKPFDEKQPVLAASKVYMNRHFGDPNLKVWDEESIKDRAKALARLAVTVWPGPPA
jgi:uncharacterized protein with ParB-like and HNH nuclease domain